MALLEIQKETENLLRKKKVSSLREAFNKYLSPGKPAYRSSLKHSVKEAIDLIKECGGIAVLAHPHMITDQSWIEEFIGLGIEGLEIAYHSMSAGKASLYRNLVLKHKLVKTGGSDAHGTFKEHINVGDVVIPYEWVDEMRQRLIKVTD